jgi:hypothetical protein
MGLSRRRRSSAARLRLGPSIFSRSSSQTSRRLERRLAALIPLLPIWRGLVLMWTQEYLRIVEKWLQTVSSMAESQGRNNRGGTDFHCHDRYI